MQRETYDYTSDRAKVRTIIEEANFNYKYVLIHIVKHAGRWHYVSVYFMNEENKEVAYAGLELFPLCGFTMRDEPIVWSLEFLTNKAYRRYDKSLLDILIKEGKQLDEPEWAANYNSLYKNHENTTNFLN